MKKIVILSLTLLATGVGMSLPGMARAEDQPAAPSSQSTAPKSDHDGMTDGDMKGMKMEGMSKMKENCDKMMPMKTDDSKGKMGSAKTDSRC
jgi:hypothetical protein